MSALVFLHLSDIHFRKNAGTTYDQFKDLRNELELDLKTFSNENFERLEGIFVTGDIAFSGIADEYEIAFTWLKHISEMLDLSPAEKVKVIPGNHDIHRDTIRESKTLQGYHRDLRNAGESLNDTLVGFLESDKEARRILYKPLQAYVDFAARFQCNISADRPFWEDPHTLNDGSKLIVRGMNSTLISDEHDTDASHKLVVGNHQLEMTRQDGVEYMSLCHHPPPWLLDQDEAENLLTDRARIQLFGHKHKHRLVSIENSVRLVAGAMQPDKREPLWQPRYNFVAIEVLRNGADQRSMQVTVYPRVFDGLHFGPTDAVGVSKIYNLSLEPWSQNPASTVAVPPDEPVVPTISVSTEGGLDMGPGRRLTYRFLSLPYHERLKIVQQLNLVRPDDEGLRDSELYPRYFARASERKHLHELWNLINQYSGENQENPFEPSKGGTG